VTSTLVPDQAPGPASIKILLTLAWPIVLARATQAVVGFADAMMVAPLGPEALAATTTGAMNTFGMIILPMGTVLIIQSFVAQLRGAGQLDSTPRYAFYGLALAALAGLLAATTVPLLPWLLGRFDFAPGVHHQMARYMEIRLFSVAAAVGTEAIGNWYGGLGRTRPAMVAGLITMVANIAGNALLIAPRFGLPGYGVAGAAIASVTATWIGFVVLLAAFAVERRRALGARRDTSTPGAPATSGVPMHAPRLKEFLRVLRFGFPNGVNWFLEFAAFALFINVVIAHLGTTVLAAFNVVIQINAISFMPAFGLSSAGAILVGEAIGRRAQHHVGRIVRLTALVTGGWMASIGVIYVIAPAALIGLFRLGTDDTAHEIVRVGSTMLALSAVWQLFDAAGLTLGESLRAAGDTTWCMGARLILAWLVFTPVAWGAVLWGGGGVITVMFSLVGYLLALSVALALRFASGHWRRIDLVEPAVISAGPP